MKKYFKKFITLFSGVFIAQLLGVLLIPIISRLYSPENFGELSLFVSITGVVAIISTLKLNEAIMIAKTNDEVYKIIGSIVFFSLILLIILSSLALLIIILTSSKIIDLEISLTFLLLLPFNILGLAIYNTNTIYLTKQSMYRQVSNTNVSRALSLNFSQIILSKFQMFNGLLLGNVIGNGMGMYYIFQNRFNYLKYINCSNFKYIIRNHSHFPKYNLPQAMLNNTSSILPNIMLIIPFGAVNIGLYYMTLKLLNLPTTLVSNIVTNLFYQESSSKFNNNIKFSDYYIKTIILLVSIIIIPTILLVIYGPIIIPPILGEEWLDAGPLIPWIAIWTSTMFIYTPATKVVIIHSWQRYMLYYNLSAFIIRFILLSYGIYSLDFTNTIIYLCIVNSIINISLAIIVGISLYRKEIEI